MVYIQGTDRSQTMLLPASIEDYVTDENPVRAIDAFVETLDLVSLEFTVAGNNTKGGRPRYHPATLLKLYLWGYFARIRSSRRLEEACTSNLNAIWLTGNLTPDHSTISDFRKDNAKALKTIFRQFNLICIELKLFGRELIAIDGTFIKAVNSKNRSFTKNKLKKLIKVIDNKVDDYLERLDQTDSVEPKEDKGLEFKIGKLKAKSEHYKKLLEDCQQSPSGQTNLTDPDSRQLMKRGVHTVGYNVQSAVDEKHNLMASCEVTKEANDLHLLHQMSQQAKQDLSLTPDSPIEVLADIGYHDGCELSHCEADNTTTYVPAQQVNEAGDGSISNDDFIYHSESDTYECPQGKHLPRKADDIRDPSRGKGYRAYYDVKLCRGCPLLEKCTKGKYRKLKVNFHSEALSKNAQRLKENPKLYRKRSAMVEHPFGTIRVS